MNDNCDDPNSWQSYALSFVGGIISSLGIAYLAFKYAKKNSSKTHTITALRNERVHEDGRHDTESAVIFEFAHVHSLESAEMQIRTDKAGGGESKDDDGPQVVVRGPESKLKKIANFVTDAIKLTDPRIADDERSSILAKLADASFEISHEKKLASEHREKLNRAKQKLAFVSRLKKTMEEKKEEVEDVRENTNTQAVEALKRISERYVDAKRKQIEKREQGLEFSVRSQQSKDSESDRELDDESERHPAAVIPRAKSDNDLLSHSARVNHAEQSAEDHMHDEEFASEILSDQSEHHEALEDRNDDLPEHQNKIPSGSAEASDDAHEEAVTQMPNLEALNSGDADQASVNAEDSGAAEMKGDVYLDLGDPNIEEKKDTSDSESYPSTQGDLEMGNSAFATNYPDQVTKEFIDAALSGEMGALD